MKILAGCMAVEWLLVAPSVVFAQPTDFPSECDAGTRQDFYDGGWQKAEQWREEQWRNLIVCPDIDHSKEHCPELLVAMVEIINLEEPENANAACEFGGFVDRLAKLYDELDSVEEDCCDTGSEVGKMYAHTYCILALTGFVTDPGDWVRPPVNNCGFFYEWCCDREFDYYTYWYPNDEVTPPNDECRPYISGDPWGQIHNHVREMTCQYPAP